MCDVNGQCVLTPDMTPPTTPRDLRVRALSMTELEVTWTGSTDDRGISMYVIDRAADAVNYRSVGTSTSPRFVDRGLTPAARRWYRVQAVDTSGNRSTFTVAQEGTTLAPPDAGIIPTDAGAPPPRDATSADAPSPPSPVWE